MIATVTKNSNGPSALPPENEPMTAASQKHEMAPAPVPTAGRSNPCAITAAATTHNQVSIGTAAHGSEPATMVPQPRSTGHSGG